jgi:hypothetical protein
MHTKHDEPALETQENTLKHEQEPTQLFASTASTYQVVSLFWAASFFFSTVPETFSLYRRPSRLVRKGTRKSLKFTFIDTDSTFDCLYPLDFRQSPSMTEFCRNQVHTGTPHIFCLTTTCIPYVFVKNWTPVNHSVSRLYKRCRHLPTSILSTCVNVLQCYRYVRIKSTQT